MGFRPPFGPGREMAALTPDGARTGVNGLVIATIRENVVIIGKPIMYGDGIHLTVAHKREWSYGFKPDNKTVPLPCYLESPYDHQRESSTS